MIREAGTKLSICTKSLHSKQETINTIGTAEKIKKGRSLVWSGHMHMDHPFSRQAGCLECTSALEAVCISLGMSLYRYNTRNLFKCATMHVTVGVCHKTSSLCGVTLHNARRITQVLACKSYHWVASTWWPKKVRKKTEIRNQYNQVQHHKRKWQEHTKT